MDFLYIVEWVISGRELVWVAFIGALNSRNDPNDTMFSQLADNKRDSTRYAGWSGAKARKSYRFGDMHIIKARRLK